MIQPVISRELTALVHRSHLGRDRLRVGILGLFLLLAAYLVESVGGGSATGATIFGTLAWILWLACVLFGAAATADTLSRERREGTLGLLFLTPLSAWDVVIGKLGGGTAQAVYRLLTLSPMLTCSLLLGGIAGMEVLVVVGLCLNTLFLALSFGVFVSSTQTDDRAAFNLTFFGFLGVAMLPFGMAAVLPAWPLLSINGEPVYLLLSPAYAIRAMAFHSWLGRYIFYSVAVAAALQQAMSWSLLFATAARCRQVALERPPSRLGTWWRALQQWWLFGSARHRRRSRTRLLNVDPIVWLALRHRRKQLYVWVLLLFLVGLASVLIWQEPGANAELLIGFAFAVLAIFKSWLISETCSRLVDDRRSGALELILTTNTSVAGWIRGQALALRRLFLIPLLTAIGVVFAVAAWEPGELFRPANLFPFVVVLAVAIGDVPAIFWMCLWEGLAASSVQRAAARMTVRVLMPAYAAATASFLLLLLIQLNWKNEVETLAANKAWAAWLVINLVTNFWIVRHARPRVRQRFQQIVSDGEVRETEPADGVLTAVPRHGWADALRWHIRRRPAHFGIGLLGLVGVTFIGIRNAIWDNRVAVARTEMWRAKVPTNLPVAVLPGRVNSPATLEKVQALANETKVLRGQTRSLHRYSNPYAPSNRLQIEAYFRGFESLADQIVALPPEANFPWGDWDSFPNPNQSIPGGTLAGGSLLVTLRMQRAVEAGDRAQALRLLAAICHLGHKWESAPSPWQALGFLDSEQPGFHAVEAVNRWLNTSPPTRTELVAIADLLAAFDSWAPVDRHLRLLPVITDYCVQNPAAFRFVAMPALVKSLDYVVPGTRIPNELAYRNARRLVDALELPEPQRLKIILSESAEVIRVMGASPSVYMSHVPCRAYAVRADLIGRVRAAGAAIQVELFRRDHGRLPADPAEATAGTLTRWPVNPVDGQPLELIHTPVGYQIVGKPPLWNEQMSGKPNVFAVQTVPQ